MVDAATAFGALILVLVFSHASTLAITLAIIASQSRFLTAFTCMRLMFGKV
jgi:hypothetical protein